MKKGFLNKAIIFFSLAITALLFTNAGVPTVSSDPVFHHTVYEWRSYLEFNPDLVQAGIRTQAAADQHWRTYGYLEGRRASAGFSSQTYLERYPDLQNAFGPKNYARALIHYVQSGLSEGRSGVVAREAVMLGGGNAVLSNGVLAVRTEDRYASAVSEIWFNGKQIVNNNDTGRLVQTALTYDGKKECDNPTEGGAETDKAGPSSSITNSLRANFETPSDLGKVSPYTVPTLSTKVQAAYFIWGNQTSQHCRTGTEFSNPLSTTFISKRIELGYKGLSNALRWKVFVHVDRPHQSMGVEALTGYHNGEFNRFYRYNYKTQSLQASDLIEENGGDRTKQAHPYPLVLATEDGKHAVSAIGLDADETVQTLAERFQISNAEAARDAFTKYPLYSGVKAFAGFDSKTSKWAITYRFDKAVRPGIYPFEVIVLVGTLAQVTENLRTLQGELHDQGRTLLGNKTVAGRGFKLADYLTFNPDLAQIKTWSPEEFENHYLLSGLGEKRRGSVEFSAASYLQRYPDLQNVLGPENYTAALKHYLRTGIREGRSAVP